MTDSQRLLVSLIRSAVFAQDISDELPVRSPNWQEVFFLARAVLMDGIVYKAIRLLPGDILPDQAFLDTWKNIVLHMGLIAVEKERLVADIFKQVNERGLNAFVFKGCVLADLYPEPYMRVSSDTDIWVDSSDISEMYAILSGLKLECDMRHSKENVVTWARGIHRVEVHKRLCEDYHSRETDILDSFGLTSKDKRDAVKLRGVAVETMEPTGHLIYQMYHLVKHLTFKGMSLRHFVDITLFANRYADRIDFTVFWASMKALTYDRFCELFFRICRAYFTLTPRALPAWCADAAPDESDFDRFWDFAFGLSEDGRDDISASAVFQQYYGDKQTKTRRIRILLALMFPGASSLSQRYAYARKRPLLLPVSWVHRFFVFMLDLLKNGKTLARSAARANEKITFLEQLGLWDKGDKTDA